MKGKFIVFEGISGSGKETQAKLLCSYLQNQKINSIITYHPTPEMKKVISDFRASRAIDHISQTYLLLADRYDRVTKLIKPELEKGTWVISLRCFISALVYQAETEEDRLYIKSEFQRFEPVSTYLFYFDIQPEVAYERIKQRNQETGESFGFYETIEMLRQKRDLYRTILQNYPHIEINAGDSIELIQEQLQLQLSAIFS